MNPKVRNILAVVAGLLIGGSINMALIMSSGAIIPYPEGFIEGDMENLIDMIPKFEPKHFIMPFLAHALGTLVGAFVAAKIAATRKMMFALFIGVFFLFGGIKMAMDVPAPLWYDVVDLTLAYIPMAFIGGKLASPKKA